MREADRFSLPISRRLQRSGVTSRRSIATALNERAVRTAHGGLRQMSSVRKAARAISNLTQDGLIEGKNGALRQRREG